MTAPKKAADAQAPEIIAETNIQVEDFTGGDAPEPTPEVRIERTELSNGITEENYF